MCDSDSRQFTLEMILFACIVVELNCLGNIRSEELEGYIITRVQTERAVC